MTIAPCGSIRNLSIYRNARVEASASADFVQAMAAAGAAYEEALMARHRAIDQALRAAQAIYDEATAVAQVLRESARERAVDAYIAAYANPGPDLHREVAGYDRDLVLKMALDEREACPR